MGVWRLTGILGRGPSHLTSRNHALGSSLSFVGRRGHCWGPAKHERGVTAEAVSKLCEQGHFTAAVEGTGVLVQTCNRISKFLWYRILKLCVGQKDLPLGRLVHALIVKAGYESDTFLCNHILRLYASHGRLEEAMDVFTTVPRPDAYTWSVIISAHGKHGRDRRAIELYHGMCRSGVRPHGHVFVAALQACAKGADLKTGQQVHAQMLASGVELNLFVWNCLVDMYAKCGSLKDAQRVFDGLEEKDVVTWSAMISGYSQQSMGEEALQLYKAMREEGVVAPNPVTYLCLLQACASVGTAALDMGRHLHAQLRAQGHEADVFVANSLVNMYAKCGSVEDAQGVFDALGHKTVVTWTALIAGYSQQGMGQEALRLYSSMQEEGIATPDAVTFACLLQACASVGTPALEKGRELHAQIRQQGLQGDVFVANNLVNMYVKCGSLKDAQEMFDGLGNKDVVTWTALIAGYSQPGMGQEALHLYLSMQEEGLSIPDSVTFVFLLQACANVAALHLGRQLHEQIRAQGLEHDVFVASSLINMYAKSGSMVDAQEVFDAMPERSVITWSALIAGYTCQGHSESVFHLVQRMREDGIEPDSITFLSILTVCSHLGLVNTGQEYFEAMSKRYGITPTVDHYSCMVDLLGRAGQLDEALTLVKTMPVQANVTIWNTVLAACQKWCNVELGRHAFQEAVKLDKNDAAPYVMMSNIYATAQMWDQALEMQVQRTGIGAWKQPGQSWWTDMDGVVHSFLVGNGKRTGKENNFSKESNCAAASSVSGLNG